MKLAITISAALALVAFNQDFAAAQTRQDLVIKVAGRPASFGPYAPYPWSTFLYN
jgi:hypothetical protein